MSRFSKTIKALRAVVRNPWLLNKVLEEDKVWRDYVRDKYAMTGGFPVVRPELIFGDFSETVSPFAYLDGGSKPTDLALLKRLARSLPDCSYFEIGTWRGESVANVSQVAKDCFTFNLSQEEMARLGWDPGYIEQHGMFSRGLPNVRHIEGNTKSFDFKSLKRKFDLIFIDGDHHYEMVKNDTGKVFENLVHDRTIVVWHDYAKNQERVRYEVMAGILDGVPEKFHGNIRHIAHTICAVYFPEPVEGVSRDILQRPTGFFNIRLDYHDGLDSI